MEKKDIKWQKVKSHALLKIRSHDPRGDFSQTIRNFDLLKTSTT